MANSSKLDWRKAGAEVAAIVFAVLLALWLEGWREDLERQERAEEFLVRIHAEVSQNRTDLMGAVVENAERIDGLGVVLADNDVTLQRIAPFLEISGGATIDAAWQSAQMTMATSDMPVETVAVLSALYDTQAYYANYLQSFFHQFTDLVVAAQNEESSRTAIQTLRLHLQITNDLAEQTIRRYDNFLGLSRDQEGDAIVSSEPDLPADTP